jgi:molybdate-binding protein
MAAVINTEADTFMSVHQIADYLHLNEKKVYALVSEWILDSSHGGLLTDRLIIAGSDDPLLYRLILEFAQDTGSHALISYSPTGTRLGLDLLQSHRVDACCMHWGPQAESDTRHPALLRQYSQHKSWVLIRAFKREQGLIVSSSVFKQTQHPQDLFDKQFRWALRQSGAGAQRFLLEVLSTHGLSDSELNTGLMALSEREAAAAIAMGQADIAPGARSAAHEYGLEFIPFGWEAFDLTLPRDIWFRRLFQDLITRLKSASCQKLAEGLTGYDLSDSGELVWGYDH